MANFLIGSAGVTVDGSTTTDTFEVITGASAVTVDALAGDDTVKLSAVNPSNSLFKLGDGEDTFSITTANATGMDFQNQTIRGGVGNDTISVGTFSSEVNGMEIRGNEGTDTLNLDLTSLDGTASSINLQGNAGNDTIDVAADDAVYNTTIGGGKGVDGITYIGGTLNASTVIGGFGQDTVEVGNVDVSASLIQLGNGDDSDTDSADTLIYSGVISNSTVKGGAGGDTINMSIEDNSTAAIIEGNAGNDTLNINAAGDYESTEFRLGAGADTFTFTGGDAGVSAEIYGGAGNDDINIVAESGLVVYGGVGADDIEYLTGTTYGLAFGDTTEASLDQYEVGVIGTGDTVNFEFAGEDLTIQSSEVVTAVVNSVTSEMDFTGGIVFFGDDAAVDDVTAAVDYLEAGLAADEAAAFSLASGRASAGAGAEFYLFVQGQTDETSILAELTDAGQPVSGDPDDYYSLTVADTFSASTLTFTI
jgi:fibronectin-binding autotransporter adhesin